MNASAQRLGTDGGREDLIRCLTRFCHPSSGKEGVLTLRKKRRNCRDLIEVNPPNPNERKTFDVTDDDT